MSVVRCAAPSHQHQHCEILYLMSGAGLPLRPSVMAHWDSGWKAAFLGTLGEGGWRLPWTVLSLGSEERILDFCLLEYSA